MPSVAPSNAARCPRLGELKRLDVELRLDTCQTGAQADKMRLKWTQALVDALPPRECAWEHGLRIV